MAVKHACYSALAVKDGCGSYIWATPDGGEVELTSVTIDRPGESYKWADKEYRGLVTHAIRQGAPRTKPYGLG